MPKYRLLKEDEIVAIAEVIGATNPMGPAGFLDSVGQEPFVVVNAIEKMPWQFRDGIPLTTYILAALCIGWQMAEAAREQETETAHD